MMPNSNIKGYVVMESVSEPMKPKILKTVNEPGIFYARFESCLQSFNCFNRNGRNYNLAPMEEAFKAEHIVELLRKGTWTGENGHPDSENMKRILSIDPTKICHRICEYEFRGTNVYATIETLNDDAWGKQFTKHILQGLHPSFSLRALAAITKLSNGKGEIKTKPHIITYDRVVLPSHKEAYMDNEKPVEIIKSTESYKPKMESHEILPAIGNTYNDALHIVHESAMLSVLNYIKEESQNYKELTSWFNSNMNEVRLVDENTVCVPNDDGKKMYVYLEDYIHDDIHNFFKKLHI